MARRNKFGIEAPDVAPVARERSAGPMNVAVREAAQDLKAATEAKIEQRRRNAEEAREYRAAREEGRVLVRVPLDEVKTDALPRDRIDLDAVASSDEMEELKSSIRTRGQKEPIELYRDGAGELQLKKGWRRLTALRQLHAETGDPGFAVVIARIEGGEAGRLDRYIDMVEENVVREDLTFAEMAQVVLEAAADPEVEEEDTDTLVNRLYGSLHKMKRSYIRSFVFLLTEIGAALAWPKDVPRNLGVEVARRLQREGGAGELAQKLSACASAEEQRRLLEGFVAKARPGEPRKAGAARDEKFSFRVDEAKVTARRGECRIVMDVDFTKLPRDRLEKAIALFNRALREA